jgi:hypothetical protein
LFSGAHENESVVQGAFCHGSALLTFQRTPPDVHLAASLCRMTPSSSGTSVWSRCHRSGLQSVLQCRPCQCRPCQCRQGVVQGVLPHGLGVALSFSLHKLLDANLAPSVCGIDRSSSSTSVQDPWILPRIHGSCQIRGFRSMCQGRRCQSRLGDQGLGDDSLGGGWVSILSAGRARRSRGQEMVHAELWEAGLKAWLPLARQGSQSR